MALTVSALSANDRLEFFNLLGRAHPAVDCHFGGPDAPLPGETPLESDFNQLDDEHQRIFILLFHREAFMRKFLGSLLLFFVVPVFFVGNQESAQAQVQNQTANGSLIAPLAASPWREVDQLTQEQKFQAALDKANEILKSSRTTKSNRLTTEALIKSTQLQLGLHGYETAVRFLKDEAWPDSPEDVVLLQLYYAHALMAYQQMYGYEIGQRETMAVSGKIDLRALTTEQIGREIGQAFDSAMAQSGALAAPVPAFMRTYLLAGNYPPGIQPTLRDAIVYMAVEHLARQGFWSPLQTNEVYKLDAGALVHLKLQTRIPAADIKAHPLEKLASWLGEHKRFHTLAGRKEAALEAHYQALKLLQSALTEDADQILIRETLRSIQKESRDLPWWSRGQALLATFIRDAAAPDRMIEARREALAGREAYPQSVGGKMCAAIISEIEAPTSNVVSMSLDSAGKKSIEVNSRNVSKFYVRAYAVDFEQRIKMKLNRDLHSLDWTEAKNLLPANVKPVAAWTTSVEKTVDFLDHRTFVQTPDLKKGLYVVAISQREDFAERENQIHFVTLNISDLVMSFRNIADGSIETKVVSGATGNPVADAELTLYRFSWEHQPEVVTQQRTKADGYVQVLAPPADTKTYWNYFFVVRFKGDLSVSNGGVYFSKSYEPGEVKAALIYTDRAIYRPQQKVLFKVVAYSGNSQHGQFATAKEGETIHALLYDPNNQVVGDKTLKLNSFGSASGEFIVPAGRPLGAWRVQSNVYGGSAQIRVEEYKRPTFETEFKPSSEELHINKKARVVGEAHYYFGLPVTAGQVKWRVTRAEVTPWWWGYWGWWEPSYGHAPQTVASGTSAIDSKGQFTVEFTPEADPRKSNGSTDLTYNFAISADVTDEGGETRTASHTYRVGFVGVETVLNWTTGFFTAGQSLVFDARRTTLDGKPAKGEGTYKLVRLTQPSGLLLPAGLPRDARAMSGVAPVTESDRQRARWETTFDWSAVTKTWKEADVVAQGKVQHDIEGNAKIDVKSISATGAYRLFYETKDQSGAVFKVSRDLLVGGSKSNINLPILFLAERDNVVVGSTARVFLHSGIPDQTFAVEKFRSGRLIERRKWVAGRDSELIDYKVTSEDRGGFSIVVSGVRDHQLMRRELNINVPWSDRQLKLQFSTFRDHLRPGSRETFRISVKDDKGLALARGAGEVLALMYDRSLDFYGAHSLPSVTSIYSQRMGVPFDQINLAQTSAQVVIGNPAAILYPPQLFSDRLLFQPSYGIGGPGRRGGRGGMMSRGALEDGVAMEMAAAAPAASNMAMKVALPESPAGLEQEKKKEAPAKQNASVRAEPGTAPEANAVRSNFSETAFFSPHLVIGEKGMVAVEFEVPDSVTSWRVLANAVTRDMRGGTVSEETKSVKELMVRPYVPRFLREGDRAEIKVSINNASLKLIAGEVTFDIEDADSGKSVIGDFGLKAPGQLKFSVGSNGTTTVGFPIVAPKKVGLYAFKIVAKANPASGGFSDGERRPFPVLPSRMHLAQSRFVALKNVDRKTLEFKDLAAGQDPSLLNEKMVVNVDAQLFYGVLQALPYLVKYPYECTEQTLNRFLSTGIVSSVFTKYPAVAKMARDFAARKTQLEKFDEPDANRRMALEETPWLEAAQGGRSDSENLVNVLNQDNAKAERDRALARLKKMQLPSGAFPWFEGGPADEHMTLYMLMGFARALEFKVDVPKDVSIHAWTYIRGWLDTHLEEMMSHDCCSETVTMVNFALSSYPDESWTGDGFDAAYRQKLLNYSFNHWKQHSPLIKGYLALTLKRMGRAPDAKLVWDSVMDSAKYDDQLGSYWAPEERAWLWYNDTIESHAFSLRVQMELNAQDKHNDGLVQWLFLNKKLNHWKSTRATAEVIYSLVSYLDRTAQLGQKEVIDVEIGGQQKTQFTFEPDSYSGKKNQVVVPGEKVTAQTAKISISKSTPGFAFASATWHFSTEKLPADSSSDFFSVQRRYFKREHVGSDWQLKPLAEGASVAVGDEVEVQLSLKTKHEAEYVHLQDPRAAGLEPETLNSGYKWDFGIFWYEETRDSGSNFFFSRLPVGEYTFKYRLRANMAGQFRIGPATVQSMYAPEFNAYSAGHQMAIAPAVGK